jgi:hypothetical protein
MVAYRQEANSIRPFHNGVEERVVASDRKGVHRLQQAFGTQ